MLKTLEEKMPLPSLLRGLLERCFSPERLNALFAEHAEEQYTRTLLFSEACELLLRVVLKLSPSVHAAYQTAPTAQPVSKAAVYAKLAGVEPAVAAALVRETAQDLGTIRAALGLVPEKLCPGYEVYVVDGNCLAGTEKRLPVHANVTGAALPGKALVVFTPETHVVVAVLPCEAAYRPERELLKALSGLMAAGQVWLADRNFCTARFFAQAHAQQARGVVRHHAQFPVIPETDWQAAEQDSAGQAVQERRVRHGEQTYRQIQVALAKPTRSGETTVTLLTDLPAEISAAQIADLYLKRWTLETAFQQVEKYFQSEINTLAYPRAALFGFCLALVLYNIFSVMQASVASVQPEPKPVLANLSGYYIGLQLAGTFPALLILSEPRDWQFVHTLSTTEFAHWLQHVARHVPLRTLQKHPRGPKKVKPKRPHNPQQPHVSTYRLLHPGEETP